MDPMNDDAARILPELLARFDDSAGWWVQSASGGVNNRVYLAGQGSDPALTVRVTDRQDDPQLGREARIVSSIQGATGCVPELLTTITDGPEGFGTLLVYRYAAGSTRPLAQVSLHQAQALGKCLAGLHAVRHDVYEIWPDLVPERGTFADCLRDRLAAIARYRSLQLPDYEAIYQELQTLPASEDWDGETFCQLHGDLGPGNIVWGDECLTLIDWEYSRAGDPAEDLAYLLVEQPVPAAHREAIFAGYLAAGGDPAAIRRHTAYLPLVALDSALWWADWALDQGALTL